MRDVLNKAQYAIHAKLGDNVFRFEAREIKPIPEQIVLSPEFKQYSTLADIGVHRGNVTKEIKTPEPNVVTTTLPEVENASVILAEPEVTVVDDISTKETIEIDTAVEVKEKPKVKRGKKKDK